MTPERTKELLPVMRAFAEGKTIQYGIASENKWADCYNPEWFDHVDYRIKPEPREWWLNNYDWGACLHNTKEFAETHKMDNCVETVRLREVIE